MQDDYAGAAELGKQSEILKAVYQNNALKFGVYASVIHPGVINLDDTFTLG